MSAVPPLAAVRVFEAAARHENYSRAAEELGLSQAGVSYQIRLLEERLGAQLFARRGRGVALTPLGRRIAPTVTEAFAALSKAFAAVQADNEAVLTITCSRTFASNWLAARLGAFNLLRPNLAVRLHVSDDIVDLAAGEVDLAIRGVVAPEPGMASHFLMRQLMTPMASPAFLARHRIEKPADLLEVPRVSPDDDWWRLWFKATGEVDFDLPSGTRRTFDWQVLDGSAALAGQGVALLSPPMFTHALEAGLLVPLFDRYALEPRHFWLVYPEYKRNLAKVRAFRDWLLASIRETAGDGDPLGILRPD